jgi:hypothetical protein
MSLIPLLTTVVPRRRYLVGYRPRHLIFHALYSRLHRRYYNSSVTNGSLTSGVDYSLLAVGLRFNCWLLSSPAGSLTRLQNSKLKNSRLKDSVGVGVQPKVACGEPSRSHQSQPFRKCTLIGSLLVKRLLSIPNA